MKNTFLFLLVLIVVALGGYLAWDKGYFSLDVDTTNETATTTDEQMEEETAEQESETVIGQSVGGNDIVAYHFGSGDDEIVLVGGIHGGYSWNTALVAQEAANYFEANENSIPANVMVTVIPVLNPDGLEEVVGTPTANFSAADVPASAAVRESGRFNSNDVDLNRNFDCDWQAQGTWQTKTVSGGSAAFSEPESQAIRGYVQASNPAAVVVWYSSAGGVYSSNCHEGVLADTSALTSAFAQASGYPAYEEFNYYEITGDMVNWLAKEGVPAISVLLTNHTDVEWSKNRAGIEAVLEYFAEEPEATETE